MSIMITCIKWTVTCFANKAKRFALSLSLKTDTRALSHEIEWWDMWKKTYTKCTLKKIFCITIKKYSTKYCSAPVVKNRKKYAWRKSLFSKLSGWRLATFLIWTPVEVFFKVFDYKCRKLHCKIAFCRTPVSIEHFSVVVSCF